MVVDLDVSSGPTVALPTAPDAAVPLPRVISRQKRRNPPLPEGRTRVLYVEVPYSSDLGAASIMRVRAL